jgi:uroporphyrin-3 C-methyltransferase
MSDNIQPAADRAGENIGQGSVAAAPAKTRRPGFGVGVVLALLALALIAWQWYDSRQHFVRLEETLSRRLAEFDNRSRESAMAAAQAREDVREALVKLGLLEQKFAESQNQQIALEALYQELSRNRDEWALAEIEQILLIASQQLQLAGNAKAALIALQTADARLQRLDKPQFIGLRKAINKDIERLQALPLVDVVGYSLRLDGLIAAVDGLPLVIGGQLPREKSAAGPRGEESPWTKLGREIWQDLRQLVRIQNMENPAAPLLSPSQAYFLRENLKLRLLSARFALLRRDEATYREDLKAAQAWIRGYFDGKAKPTQDALKTLEQLAKGPVTVEMPDLSASLDAVRKFKLARERNGR